MLIEQSLTARIVGLAIEVHRNTGRGLLESVYERCLCYELQRVGLQLEAAGRHTGDVQGIDFRRRLSC